MGNRKNKKRDEENNGSIKRRLIPPSESSLTAKYFTYGNARADFERICEALTILYKKKISDQRDSCIPGRFSGADIAHMDDTSLAMYASDLIGTLEEAIGMLQFDNACCRRELLRFYQRYGCDPDD